VHGVKIRKPYQPFTAISKCGSLKEKFQINISEEICSVNQNYFYLPKKNHLESEY
jgi:hypothetical protein